ncbi:MAG: site-2 protease family protein [Desulfurococcaceae archaeon]
MVRSVGLIGWVNDKPVYDLFIDRVIGDDEFRKIYVELVEKHKYFPLQPMGSEPIVRLIPIKDSPRRTKFIALILAITTVLTVSLTGYGLALGFHELFYRDIMGLEVDNYEIMVSMISFTSLFLLTLMSHELGHLYVLKKSGMIVSGPFLIPAPPIQLGFIGTLGAVINMKTLPPTKRDLARLGLSGPLIGFLISLIVGLIGFYLSPLIPLSYFEKPEIAGKTESVGIVPLTLLLIYFMRSTPGHVSLMHPLLFCSYIIMLVTFLNLIPIGQLDGGHVVRAYVSADRHSKLGLVIPYIMFSTGLILMYIKGFSQASAYYISLSLILAIFYAIFGRRKHPGAANHYSSRANPIYLVLYLILIVLTLPIPT